MDGVSSCAHAESSRQWTTRAFGSQAEKRESLPPPPPPPDVVEKEKEKLQTLCSILLLFVIIVIIMILIVKCDWEWTVCGRREISGSAWISFCRQRRRRRRGLFDSFLLDIVVVCKLEAIGVKGAPV